MGLLAAGGAQVLVIGAGPAGLAVAQSLKVGGVTALQVDRFGEPGGAYRRMYPPLVLSSPVKYLGLPGKPFRTAGQHATASEYARYLEHYAHEQGLAVERREVVAVERSVDGFAVRFRDSEEPLACAFVVVASGICDYPAMPQFPGLKEAADAAPRAAGCPRVLHAQKWAGPESVIGERLLIVGGAMRAVELAEECAGAGLSPIVSARHGVVRSYPRRLLGVDLRSIAFPALRRLPLWTVRERCRDGWRFPGIDRGFRKFVRRGAIALRPDVARLDGRRVHFVDGSQADVDVIVCATGYRFEMPFLPPEIPRAGQGYPLTVDGECVGWPGLFVLGTPCAIQADSQFIHGTVADAQVVAARLVRQLQ